MFGKSKAKAKQIQQTDTHCTELQDILRAIKHTMAVIEFSTEGIIIDANENFLRTMGYTLDEIKDKHHSMFCLPDVVRSMEYDNFWIDLRAGKSKTDYLEESQKAAKIFI